MSTKFTPGVYAVYRGKETYSAAFQARVISVTEVAPGQYVPGSFTVTMTDGPTAFQYDWTRKLVMKLTTTELGGILNLNEKKVTFRHDPQAKREGAGQVVKTLSFNKAPNGGVFVDMAELAQGQTQPTRAHKISMNDDEWLMFQIFCRTAVPLLFGLSEDLCRPVGRSQGYVPPVHDGPVDSSPISAPAMAQI